MKRKPINIKTITCHNVYNFGASLQAYALMKYLQDLGHEVEIIDYKPNYLTYNIWAIGSKWNKNIFIKMLYYAYVVPKRLLMKKRRLKFDAFTKNKLNLTAKTYHSFDELVDDPPYADVFFAGSDQIWNTSSPNGKDPSFYINFATEAAIRASYAASFSVSEISNEDKEFVKNNLLKLNYISVREDSGLKILSDLDIPNGIVVLDPVFLVAKKEWEILSSNVHNRKFIFVYDQENNSLIKRIALKIAKERKLRIIAIESLYSMSYADVIIRDSGPEKFLGLIKNCEVCLTNSFHCMAFSLIFQKEFYLFERTHQKVNSRMIDLLAYLNLKERILHEDSDLNDTGLDYKKIDNLIEIRRKISIKYIDKVLSRVYNN